MKKTIVARSVACNSKQAENWAATFPESTLGIPTTI